jgi:hypothetical protein
MLAENVQPGNGDPFDRGIRVCEYPVTSGAERPVLFFVHGDMLAKEGSGFPRLGGGLVQQFALFGAALHVFENELRLTWLIHRGQGRGDWHRTQ